jgi:predicted nucleic acid-binding protein
MYRGLRRFSHFLSARYSSVERYERALDVHGRWSFGFYDSLIVAAALSAGCRQLLSENLQHDQRVETLTIRKRFV